LLSMAPQFTREFLQERFCPTRLFRPVQLLLTFTLFHVYLLYAVVFSITKLFIHHTRVKGSRIIPLIPSVALCKEKTASVQRHMLSNAFSFPIPALDFVLGISAGWEYISSWVFNFRPQINIKPQLVRAQDQKAWYMSGRHTVTEGWGGGGNALLLLL
uniref:Acyl_transf_3 domain-containing protein n=1 Tax=Heligmosomoides polygyrus TaxID=6339 RepID=A0A183FJE9_HELPZ